MSITAIILLIIIGFILFLLEFFIIPGITVAGVAAFILVTGGIFCGYYFHGKATGNIILLCTGISMIAMFILMLKLKTWKRLGLKSTIDSRVGTIDGDTIKEGDEGITVSKLSPIGKAMINDKLFEVRSSGNYVQSNIPIVVVSIDGNKIYIETKN
jgi:membrane-bound ClpP family serine protease